MPAGTPVERTAATLADLSRYLATVPEVQQLPGLCGARRADQLQWPGAPVLPALRRRAGRHPGEPRGQARAQRSEPRHRGAAAAAAGGDRRPQWRSGEGGGSAARSAGARADRRRDLRPGRCGSSQGGRKPCVRRSFKRRGSSMWTPPTSAPRRRQVVAVDRQKAALLGVADAEVVSTLRAGIAGAGCDLPARRDQIPGAAAPATAGQHARKPRCGAESGRARRQRRHRSLGVAGRGAHHHRRTAALSQGPAAGGLRHRR